MRKSQLGRLALALLLMGSGGTVQSVAGHANDAPGTFTIHVRNYAHADMKTLTEAERVATEVFRHTGVQVRWDDTAIKSSSEDKPEILDSEQILGLSHLWLSLFPRLMAAPLSLPDNVMGVAPGSGTDRRTVYVFFDSVEALAQRQIQSLRKGDISRPASRGQILGHMIAHEIGHVLLNLPSHSAVGIMRGDWDLKDLQDATYGSLLFTPPQASVIRAEVARRTEQSAARVPAQLDLTEKVLGQNSDISMKESY